MTTTVDLDPVTWMRISKVAEEVRAAAGRLNGTLEPIPGIPAHIAGPLAALLQNIGDDMADEYAVEREHPDNIPAARWLVHPGVHDDQADRQEWTDALRLARALLAGK